MLEVMRDILQSRYLHSNVAHKQLARTSLRELTTANEVKNVGYADTQWKHQA